MDIPDQIKVLTQVLRGAYFIVDREKRIVDFNETFFDQITESDANNVIGRYCHEVMPLTICEKKCVAKYCWQHREGIKVGDVSSTDEKSSVSLEVTCIPIYNDDKQLIGALEMHLNLEEDLNLVEKYRVQEKKYTAEIATLEERLKRRTVNLVTANEALSDAREKLFSIESNILGARIG